MVSMRGVVILRSVVEIDKRRIAMRLIWMPGVRPVKVPAKIPKKIAIVIEIISPIIITFIIYTLFYIL